jgi:hypothetical protein
VNGRLAKAFVLAREVGLTRDDRIDLARVVTGREEVGSWSHLSDVEVERVLDSLAGFVFVSWLLCERGASDDR